MVIDAKAFAESHDMAEHADLFGRAALVARNPNQFETVAEIDDEERAALAYERENKWHGPFMLWYSIALCAIGAATQGWDQTGSNGANCPSLRNLALMARAKMNGLWESSTLLSS